jgi:hypothetical protein
MKQLAALQNLLRNQQVTLMPALFSSWHDQPTRPQPWPRRWQIEIAPHPHQSTTDVMGAAHARHQHVGGVARQAVDHVAGSPISLTER